LIFCADVIYARFFEKIDFLKEPIYLQMAYPVIHRISGIEGLFYELRPGAKTGKSIMINSLGMRNAEINPEKDGYRIIVMGDSVTFGPQNIETKDLFPGVAERILIEAGNKVQILNAGVSGYNTRQELIALREKYLKLKPDMVIFAFCINDLGEFYVQYAPEDYAQKKILKKGADPENMEKGPAEYGGLSAPEYLSVVLPKQYPLPYKIDRELLLHSGFYRCASMEKFMRKYSIAEARYLPNFLNTYDFEETLQEIKQIASDNDFQVRFLMLPWDKKLEWDNEFALKRLAENNIEYWDIDPVVQARIQEGARVFDDEDGVHPVEEGHTVIGHELAEKLKGMDFTSYLK